MITWFNAVSGTSESQKYPAVQNWHEWIQFGDAHRAYHRMCERATHYYVLSTELYTSSLTLGLGPTQSWNVNKNRVFGRRPQSQLPYCNAEQQQVYKIIWQKAALPQRAHFVYCLYFKMGTSSSLQNSPLSWEGNWVSYHTIKQFLSR